VAAAVCQSGSTRDGAELWLLRGAAGVSRPRREAAVQKDGDAASQIRLICTFGGELARRLFLAGRVPGSHRSLGATPPPRERRPPTPGAELDQSATTIAATTTKEATVQPFGGGGALAHAACVLKGQKCPACRGRVKENNLLVMRVYILYSPLSATE